MPPKSKLDLQDILTRISKKQSIPSIARDLSVHHNTVRHFLKVNGCYRVVRWECDDTPPERAER